MVGTQDNRYPAPAGSIRNGSTMAVVAPSTQTQTQTSQTSGSTSRQNMTPASLAALQALIDTLSKGGTPQQQAEMAKRKQTQQLLEGLLGQYSTGQAFNDARGLMALNLQQSMEKNMPAIQRSIEGAGTSASSAQGLLSQNLARDSALAASALGAEQARAYAGTTANLTAQLAQMANTSFDPVTKALLDALGLARGAVENSQSSSNSTARTITDNPGSTTNATYFAPADYTRLGGGTQDAATTLASAINPPTYSTIGPTDQNIADVARYQKSRGVYSDTPLL